MRTRPVLYMVLSLRRISPMPHLHHRTRNRRALTEAAVIGPEGQLAPQQWRVSMRTVTGRKRAAYPEFSGDSDGRRCCACETGRRWNDDSFRLVVQLVRLRTLLLPLCSGHLGPLPITAPMPVQVCPAACRLVEPLQPNAAP